MATQTVLITGATGGLGAAVTTAFTESGWRVVAPARGEHRDLPDGAEPVTADLAEPDGASRAAAVAAGAPEAPLRAVVNLVGGFATGGRVHETPYAAVESLLAANLRPTYLVTAAALPHLVTGGGGAVVCVSARAAQHPFPGGAGYATAKAAVLGFANAVAVEYGGDGVRCNTVLPGIVDTPANRAAQPEADRSRWVPPDEIAPVIRFLAGPESAPTTGAAVPVHGLR